MSEVTRILSKIEAGDINAANELLPLVYDELRKLASVRMASERADHTLSATSLVHEAYIRLVGSDQPWQGRSHFFAAAANSMRQILVNWAQAKKAERRGGNAQRLDMEELTLSYTTDPDLMLDLDQALTELAAEDQESAELVKLRLFSGLSVTEAGEVLKQSRTEAYENWKFARAWFANRGLNGLK